MIETFYCPICGKEATYHLNNTNWSWHHNCKGIFIRSDIYFDSKEEARLEWGKYCTQIKNILDFEYTYGYEQGFMAGEMEIEK